MRCSTCGREHDVSKMEVAFQFPDRYWVLSLSERETKGSLAPGGDACVLFDDPDQPPIAGFVRALLPIPLRGESAHWNWGVWVELTLDDLEHVASRWDADDQEQDPPLRGKLANDITEFRPSLDLTGQLQLTGLTSRPTFRLDADSSHALAIVQRDGITRDQAIQWLLVRAHTSTSRPAV